MDANHGTTKTDSAKYDRQLRLWGEEGQGALESARVCLIHATTTGTETLKNLVLPGIGRFTIVDDKKIEADDFSNFFIPEGSIGKSRAQVTCDNLRELNDLAHGEFLDANPVELLNTRPEYFKTFTIIIANNLEETALLTLSHLCWENAIVLVVTHTVGFVGYVRVQIPEHAIVLSKPDNPADDLRIANPFKELEEYANSIHMETLNSAEHSHVPFPILLLKLTNSWKEKHGGKLPENSSEKSAFRSEILKAAKSNTENNFEEAYRAYFKAYTPTRIPSAVEAILKDEKSKQVNSASSNFWIIASAVSEFVNAEGNGFLPLPGSIPDMTATTNGYIQLQKIYQDKASQDVEAVRTRVNNILKKIGKAEDFISLEEIKKFCKNINFIQVIRYTPLFKEYSSQFAAQAQLTAELRNPETNLVWYIALRAAKRFELKHKRFPGVSTSISSMSAADISNHSDTKDLRVFVDIILAELGLDTKSIEVDFSAAINEMVRYGGDEIHTVASFMGGVTSQEVIKLITHQYVPIDNTFIYNANISATTTISL